MGTILIASIFKRRLLAVLLPLLALIAFWFVDRALAADAVVGPPCDEAAFTAALNAVQSSGGGTITFNCGPNATIPISTYKTITGSVTLDGGNQITLSGGGFALLFYVAPAGRLSLKHITLSDAYNTSGTDGGAIQNYGSLVVANSAFRNNRTTSNASGGAIFSTGLMTISNSLFEDNQAGNGGALYVKWSAARADISQTVFRNNQTTNTANGWGGAILIFDGAGVALHGGDVVSNTARFGGGIFNHLGAISSTLVVDSNAVIGANLAVTSVITVGLGGGIYNAGWLTMTTATMRDNIANKGGGLFNNSGRLLLADTTISGNLAKESWSSESGAGISNVGGNGTLRGVTVSRNIGYAQGAAIRHYGGTLVITNTTISDNVVVCALCPGASTVVVGAGGSLGLTYVTLADNQIEQGANVDVSSGSVSFRNVILHYISNQGSNRGNCFTSGGTLMSLSNNLSNRRCKK